jgi:hypothetical protein
MAKDQSQPAGPVIRSTEGLFPGFAVFAFVPVSVFLSCNFGTLRMMPPSHTNGQTMDVFDRRCN